MGFFDKLKNGLGKTKNNFNEKINNVFSSFRKVDEELLKKREIRTEKYLSSIREIALKIKRKGITPIFVTLVPVNERLDETQKIKTVADNKEKEDYIGPEFYTKKTFKNI